MFVFIYEVFSTFHFPNSISKSTTCLIFFSSHLFIVICSFGYLTSMHYPPHPFLSFETGKGVFEASVEQTQQWIEEVTGRTALGHSETVAPSETRVPILYLLVTLSPALGANEKALLNLPSLGLCFHFSTFPWHYNYFSPELQALLSLWFHHAPILFLLLQGPLESAALSPSLSYAFF